MQQMFQGGEQAGPGGNYLTTTSMDVYMVRSTCTVDIWSRPNLGKLAVQLLGTYGLKLRHLLLGVPDRLQSQVVNVNVDVHVGVGRNEARDDNEQGSS